LNYRELQQFLLDTLPMYHRQGASAYKKDLGNIRKLCDGLGNPENKFKAIHIAGTNGKGSVSHMLSAVLQANGYRTGLYVSPHYVDFRERIKVDGQCVPKRWVLQFVERNRHLIEIVQPSYFEMLVAMAFCYFADCRVEWAVIETGLGGRLDSTNILQASLCIITNISWDHADILGNTLEAIAREKAGIIKPGSLVLVGRNQSESMPVFVQRAEIEGTSLFEAEKLIENWTIETAQTGLKALHFNLWNGRVTLEPELRGLYQAENIRTVLAAALLLREPLGLKLSIDRIVHALEHVRQYTGIAGRWQVLQTHPVVVCESAHNEDGIRYLMQQLGVYPRQQLHIVCGFVRDKDLSPVLSQLPVQATYYFVQAKIPRALAAGDLKQMADPYGLKGNAYHTVRRGLAQALRNARTDDLVLVTGSIFVVGEVLERYRLQA